MTEAASDTIVLGTSSNRQTSLSLGEELDDEIEQLLRDAEIRLRARSNAGRDDVQEVHSAEVSGAVLQSAHGRALQFKIPKLEPGKLPQPYVRSVGPIARADPSRLVDPEERRIADRPRKVEDPFQVKERQKKEKKATAGPNWFNLPRTDLTEELKRDLQVLRMRSVLDPKRHYKKDNRSKKSIAPEFCQTGTVIEGPTEFFSGRIPNKERKKTFVQEVLGKRDAMERFKSKYNEVQAAKTSGKKAHYKALKAKRSKGRHYG